MTDDEIVGNLIALMMAGQHTSNITSSWLMLNLLSRPDVLNRVMAEQEAVVGEQEHLNFKMVKDMQLLEQCVKGACFPLVFISFTAVETLRLRPPIIVIFRTADVDFMYKDYLIPKGTLVTVSPAAYPRSPLSVRLRSLLSLWFAWHI